MASTAKDPKLEEEEDDDEVESEESEEEGGGDDETRPVKVFGAFTVPLSTQEGKPPVPCPLALASTTDYFGNSVYVLLYSDHAGTEALDPWVTLMFGDMKEKDRINTRKHMVLNPDCLWAMPSVRIENPFDAGKIGKNEFAWNTYKTKTELAAAIRAGVVEMTGKTVNQAYYQNLPIVRIKEGGAPTSAPAMEAPASTATTTTSKTAAYTDED